MCAKYSFLNDELGSRFLAVTNNILLEFSLLRIFPTWSSHDRLSSNVTPRNFVHLLLASSTSPTLILKGVPEGQNFTSTILFTFRESWLARYHSINNDISCSREYLRKWMLLQLFNRVVSSANNIILLNVGNKYTSFVNKMNSNGPKQLPCAVPYVISNELDFTTLLSGVCIFALSCLFDSLWTSCYICRVYHIFLISSIGLHDLRCQMPWTNLRIGPHCAYSCLWPV